MQCRRCGARVEFTVNGLCPPCWHLPVGTVVAESTRAGQTPRVLMPPEPTTYTPGTREKLLVMAERWERSQQVHHQEDARTGRDGDGAAVGFPLMELTNRERTELLGPPRTSKRKAC